MKGVIRRKLVKPIPDLMDLRVKWIPIEQIAELTELTEASGQLQEIFKRLKIDIHNLSKK